MISITPADNKHVSRIFEIEKEAFSPPWSYEALLGEVGKEDSYFIVAEEDGADSSRENRPGIANTPDNDSPGVVGYAILRRVGDDGELMKIAVDKSSRLKGVGDLLMMALLEYSTEKMYNSIFLEVRRSNTAAFRLYEKHGFTTIRIREDYYIDPVEDAIIMARKKVI